VGHSHSELLGELEVNTLVGCVSIGVGANQTKSNDESLREQTAELGEEGD